MELETVNKHIYIHVTNNNNIKGKTYKNWIVWQQKNKKT